MTEPASPNSDLQQRYRQFLDLMPLTLSLAGGFGSLTHVDQRVQANGVLQQACVIRE